ncbi:MAG: hypothetical protein JKX85_00050 [Phycisphaeraceae bacterium]|nr:hypothetical protein [Phycisphaeraceae bacterium]
MAIGATKIQAFRTRTAVHSLMEQLEIASTTQVVTTPEEDHVQQAYTLLVEMSAAADDRLLRVGDVLSTILFAHEVLRKENSQE